MTTPSPIDGSEPRAPPWRPADAVSLALVLVAAALVEVWIVAGAQRVGWFSDSVDYLFYADFYRSALFGVGEPAQLEFYRSSRFPPLFPLLLGLFGVGSANQRGAFIVVAVLFAVALAAVWAWGRRESGRASLGCALALGTLLCPEVLLWQLHPVSEPLLVLLACGVFALALRSERDDARVLLVAALIGISPLARLIGVALVVAGVLWALRARSMRARTRVFALVVMVAPTIAWFAYRATLPVEVSYAGLLTPAGILERFGGWSGLLLERPVELARTLGALWIPAGGLAPLTLGLVLGGLAAAGWLARFRRNTLDSGYLATYLAVVLVWPFPVEGGRLLAALVPVLLMSAIEGAAWFMRGLRAQPDGRARIAAWAVFALALGSSLPTLAGFAHRATLPAAAELQEFKRSRSYFLAANDTWALVQLEIAARIAAAVEELPRVVEPGACVYAVAPAPIQLNARIRAVAFPRALAGASDARAQLAACDYFLVAYLSTEQFDQPFLYPLRHIESWTHPVLASFIELQGQRTLAVALMRRNDPPPAGTPRAH